MFCSIKDVSFKPVFLSTLVGTLLAAPLQAEELSGDSLLAQLDAAYPTVAIHDSMSREPAAVKNYSRLRALISAKRFPDALKMISEGRVSADERIFRANLLDSMGFHLTALSDRVIASYSRPTSKNLNLVGNSALILGRYGSLVSLATKLRRRGFNGNRWPASFRLGIAAYHLRRGNLQRAATWLPQRASMAGLQKGAAKLRGYIIASGVLYGLGRYKQALSLLSANFPKAPGEDMSFVRLQRSRLMFELGRFQDSLDELLLLPKNSPSWHDGMVVAAWASYHGGDLNLALGQLMNLHSPYLKNKFLPESYLLQAATLYRLCYYESASRSLSLFKKKYEDLQNTLKRVESRFSGRGLLKHALDFASTKSMDTPSGIDREEWALVMDGILSQAPLSQVDRGLLLVERAKEYAKTLPSSLKRQAQREWANARKEWIRYGARLAKGRIRSMRTEVFQSFEASLAVNVEVNTRLRERLITGAVPQRKYVNFDQELQKGYEFWPFEGEFWRDETGGYTFATSNVCAEGEGV